MLLVSNLNFNGLQSLKRIIENLPLAPATPSIGLEYYDTAKNSQFFWNGTKWVATDSSLAPANSIPATSILNLQTVIDATPISALSAAVANVSMGGFTVTNLPAPTAAGQAAEYSWVMGQINAAAAGITLEAPVEVVSIANQATLAGLLTIDGHVLVAGERVLLVGQTTASQNGPYIAATGAWTRATDILAPETFWYVITGTTYAATQWKISNPTAITVGTTAITINQFGAPINYTATTGGGLSLTGTAFAVLLATTSGLSTASGLTIVLPASSGLQLTAGGLSVLVAAGGGILATATGLAIDKSVIPTKYSTTFGDGVATSYTITHNLNTLDVVCQLRNVATGAIVYGDIVAATVNTVTIGFTTAPAVNAYRTTVIG